METAPEDRSAEELVRMRRTALIEFEIRRAPEAPNRTIARACRTSSSAVKIIRDSMVEETVLPQQRQAG